MFVSDRRRRTEMEGTMKRIIYMIRHGQTLFNQKGLMQGWCDSPLTEKGKQQAINVKNYFFKHHITFDEAYSSSLGRACETLEMITNIPYQRKDGLREWFFGKYEGERDELDPPFPFQDFFKTYGQGESQDEVIERVSHTIADIMTTSQAKTILIVSHGLSCYCFALKWQSYSQIELPRTIPNCAIFKYEFENQIFSLVDIIDAQK